MNTGLAQSPPFMAETSETKRNREPKAPQDRIEESPAFRQGGLKIKQPALSHPAINVGNCVRPVFHFFFVVFALAFLAGCEREKTSINTQDSEDSGKTVIANTFVGSEDSAKTASGSALMSADADADADADAQRSVPYFDEPYDIVIDRTGNLYVTNHRSHRIRKITPDGKVSILAGGTEGFADGVGDAAQFNEPSGIAIDAAGNLYVADTNNQCIRKITPKGEVSTLAGSGYYGDADGPGIVSFEYPVGIAIDAAGNLYVADTNNHRIRKITPMGWVSTLAGSREGFADGIGSAAQFSYPEGIVVDASGNLYVADTGNYRIRKVTRRGKVSTLAGGGDWKFSGEFSADGVGNAARFTGPSGIALDAAGNLYVGDNRWSRSIRKITPKGKVSTLAGREEGFADGAGSSARFKGPSGIAIDATGNLYVADYGNQNIRKVTPTGEVSTLAASENGVEPVTVSTLAGGGMSADARRSAAYLDKPNGIAIDKAGNLYVSDTDNHRIRKITPKGKTSILAGSTEGFADGIGSAAQFSGPSDIAIDASGNLYVADRRNNRIRKITPKGEVSTLAGSGYSQDFDYPSGIAIDAAGNLYVADKKNNRICKITSAGEVSTFAGRSSFGNADGQGSAAQFYAPEGIAVDTAGNLYVADTNNHRIRKVTPKGEVSTLAGSKEGFADGVGIAAQFTYPTRIAIDKAGNLYVTDRNRIRKITPKGEVSTLSDSTEGFADGQIGVAQFHDPRGIAIDTAGNLYVADNLNNRIRKITPAGGVSTLVGSGTSGHADGTGDVVRFKSPSGIAIDAAGNFYVADENNHRIRKITPAGEVSTFAGSGSIGNADGQGSAAQFYEPRDIAIDTAGNLYVADTGNDRIRKITPKGEVSTLAGSKSGFADGIGSTAQFDRPVGIAVDMAGHLYVADYMNKCIREITPKGEVSTFASFHSGSYGDADGTGSAARFKGPSGIAIDAAGNLYVADEYNRRIRKITPAGEVSAFAGSNNIGNVDGQGGAAQFYTPRDITIDTAGNLYVVDKWNNSIRKITSKGEVSTLAGSESGFVDGTGSAARFYDPTGIAIDTAGNLYVADYGNDRIRKITPKGEVSTFAGRKRGLANRIGIAERVYYPTSIAMDAAGNLYVADRADEAGGSGSGRISKVTPKGEVSILLGEDSFTLGSPFAEFSGIAVDAAGNLYVTGKEYFHNSSRHSLPSVTDSYRIYRVTPKGEVSILAGSKRGFADGAGSAAQFKAPSGIAIDASGNIYVADTDNHRIRKIVIE